MKVKGHRELKKPRTRPRGEWCPDQSWINDLVVSDYDRDIHPDTRGSGLKSLPFRRCNTCGKRLKPRPILDHHEGLIGYRIPPHKTSKVK